MDGKTELYIGKRYVAFVFAMLVVLGYPATRFFEVRFGDLLLLEVIIFIIGIGTVAYIVKNRKRNKDKELRKQIKTITILFGIDTMLQLLCIVLAIHLAIFVDMIYLTVGFMAVILNLVSGSPTKSYMSKHLPDSARRRAWTYFGMMLVLSLSASATRDIGNSPNNILQVDEITLIGICLGIFILIMLRSLSTKKAKWKRDRMMIMLLGAAVFMFLVAMMNNGMGISNSFGDIGALIVIGLMLFTVFM